MLRVVDVVDEGDLTMFRSEWQLFTELVVWIRDDTWDNQERKQATGQHEQAEAVN
jgi:hypothetical protein